MIRLLIIADDFTGALDTGVKFAEKGAEVRVIVGEACEFEKTDPQVSVLVVDAETRHLQAKEAYEKVASLVKKARDAKIPYIYKKTDSALRGNVGSELAAVLAAGKASVLPFVPAFPKMGRTTEQGIHYIDGIPVSESVFGSDPFEPVECYRFCFILFWLYAEASIRLPDGRSKGQKPMVLHIFVCRRRKNWNRDILKVQKERKKPEGWQRRFKKRPFVFWIPMIRMEVMKQPPMQEARASAGRRCGDGYRKIWAIWYGS